MYIDDVCMIYLYCYCVLNLLSIFLGISGYVAANMYKRMGGEDWVWNINITSALFARKSTILLNT